MSLRGLVNPNSAPTAVHFEYNRVGFGNVISTPIIYLPAVNAALPVTAELSQLLPNTCYNWRIVAANNGGTSNTDATPQTTCTLGLAPIVVTLPASYIQPDSATLNGQGTPNGLVATGYFQYGPGPAMVGSTPPSLLGSGIAPVGFSPPLNGLSPNTLYFYRALVVNSAGTNYGSIVTFTTRQYRPPIPVTQPPNSVLLTVHETRQAKAVGYSIKLGRAH